MILIIIEKILLLYQSFDINSNGDILISLPNNTFKLYDKDLNFICRFHYSVQCSSEHFFNSDGNVSILLNRDDLLIYLNDDFTIDKAFKVDTTSQNYDIRQEKFSLNNTQKNFNGYIYQLRNNNWILKNFNNGYAQLIRIDEIGNEEIIYSEQDATSSIIVQLLFIIVPFIIFIVIFIKTINSSNTTKTSHRD